MELCGEHFRINVDPSKGQGCFYEVLAKTHESMMTLLSYHCKILVVQFSFNPCENLPTNAPISRLVAVIKRRLCRRYKFARLVTGWVRETAGTGFPHYHVVLMLDGNKVNRQGGVMELVKEILESRGYPAPHFTTKTHMISRSDHSAFAKAFYHLSYLAKVNTKGSRPKCTNDYSFSRLQLKQPIITAHTFC